MSNEKPKSNREEAAEQIERLLKEKAEQGIRPVLFFEEAHDLRDDILKYLKRFHEIGDYGFKKLTAIILVAQPELSRRLSRTQGFHLREVAGRLKQVTIKPLGNEMAKYLEYRFALVGATFSKIFEDDAVKTMRKMLRVTLKKGQARAEDGNYPLAVHNLCITTMNLAAETGAKKVTVEHVLEAQRLGVNG